MQEVDISIKCDPTRIQIRNFFGRIGIFDAVLSLI